MPVLDSYLFFDGNCAEAMRFYEKTLGGKLETVMTYGESPDPAHCPTGAKDLVMHASVLVGGRRLMASDVPPGMGEGPKPMTNRRPRLARCSRPCARAARSRCRCRRPSGPTASACSPTASARRGW
ncbi:MAG: PhnB protein-like protein [Ramlibacter sp.]|nr:PhnB protein-like protein [Ramlibacter sp.]